MLYRNNRTYYLGKIENQKPIHQITVRHNNPLKFSRDFPKSAIQAALSKITDVRALLPLFSWQYRFEPFFLLNEDDKRVVRGEIKKIILGTHQTRIRVQDVICLQSIRGYAAEFQPVLQSINQLSLVSQKEPAYKQALAYLKLQPGRYSSSINIKLNPAQSGREASRQLLEQFLWIMKQNEKGIVNDIDTEFLHDFRVAIRRTRSLLSQMKDVFPSKQTQYFRQKLGDLQRKTNRLRDLDVYLLKKKSYSEVLPKALVKGIEPLFQKLEQERENEFQKVVETIKNKSTRTLIKEWERFLNTREMEKSPHSDFAIYTFSKGIIKERLNRILKKGNKLLEGKPKDEALHRLRIDCKKLRYLLEFFSSLYNPDDTNVLVKQLKSLQNLLGDYNDLTVQIDDLLTRLESLSLSEKNDVYLAAAYGGLLTHFRQKQKELRRNFRTIFEEFSAKTHLEIYYRLFF
jgi:CHAD domain-containing protein